MLSLHRSRRSTCQQVTRRELLSVGGTGLLGLSLPRLLGAEALGASHPAKAKSVIFLFLFGGPSQLETFDPKPDAPVDIRGPFAPIQTRTPGLAISEHLPRTAAVSDKFCLIRSMTHSFNDHSGAGHYIQTGRRWHVPVGAGFSATPKDWPSIGSVAEYMRQHADNDPHHVFPAYAVVPNRLGRLQSGGQYIRPGEYAGWLGGGFNPLTTMVDKRSMTDNPYFRDMTDEELTFQIQGLARDQQITLERLGQRTSLLAQLDRERRAFEGNQAAASLERSQQRALALATSPAARDAMNIRLEDAPLRDRYGRHLFGQATLMARRLVEAGVRFVTVHYDCVDGLSWDSHNNSNDVKNHLLPSFDQAYSALLTDLEERGLLDETLVVAMGEMGRTPKANKTWGRGHWSTLFPALLAGAGTPGGAVYGGSDGQAAYPRERPTSPEDLAATLYDRLGIDPGLMLPDAQGRPIPMIDGGQPIKLLG